MCHGMLIEGEAAEFGRPNCHRFGGEPALGELLRDPIARALMAADRVDSGDVYALLSRMRDNLAESAPGAR